MKIRQPSTHLALSFTILLVACGQSADDKALGANAEQDCLGMKELARDSMELRLAGKSRESQRERVLDLLGEPDSTGKQIAYMTGKMGTDLFSHPRRKGGVYCGAGQPLGVETAGKWGSDLAFCPCRTEEVQDTHFQRTRPETNSAPKGADQSGWESAGA